MKRALITGITGQDGFYLAEHLLSLGYEVHGLVRQSGLEHIRGNLLLGVSQELHQRCHLHTLSLDNLAGLHRLAAQAQFDECYHLAASSFVGEGLPDGLQTIQNNISSTHHLLGALHQFQPGCRVYYAGSSEMFGRASHAPQTESSPMQPRTAYGISKTAGYHIVRSYRENYGMFCAVGILYNHESPRRRPEFVTRKISMAVARIAAGLQSTLELGNLDSCRDWGYAPDYVRAMHAMLNHSQPDDFVVATGRLHSVRELCRVAFQAAGLDWQDHVVVNPQYLRQADPVSLVGDTSKIQTMLGWKSLTSFETMIQEMVKHDLGLLPAK